MSRRSKLINRARRKSGRLPATPEFIRFGERFNQSIDHLYGSLEEATAAILTSFKGEDRRRLRDFVASILASDLTPDEQMKLWARACTDWRFRGPDDLRRFLTQVHLDLRKGL
ncbi:hypothetical protein MMSR116_28935 [Methylobacterium mesophilicum SR1.6/6]|uniref:CdiI immunity protein domain-containing protein n=1 Tax=Methylobacterium mesophilicum SR1.6/6 TaxID=908290 RepID=A0A6B9FUB9_9HYPH|nr:hypothetical protein [Methylobacterium mesophilicum]QGY05469.1 hypothetical protein MMSR116_28935 [Methylobacterium mesophilicum SR1.6/6]